MRHSKLLSAGGLLAFAFACAANNTNGDPLADMTARAQGTITLGASHTPSSSTISPSVSVSFVPDTSAVMSACGESTVDTCTITQAPDCKTLGCKTGETCGWDDSCSAACVPVCTLSCGADQKCAMGGDGSMSCVAIQTFDAGPIAISGTNMPISVYPPYAWKTTDEGSPFAPGASLRAQAAGPTGAGFASFDVSFNATTLLEANPPLDQLNLDDVFGTDDVQLGWIPGNDRIYVLASGVGGSAKCLAEDAAGSFTLPRTVIDTLVGSGDVTVNAISLAIQRWRIDRHEDAKTVGSLDAQTIQAKAWLDFVTTSTESIALQACTSGETSCGTKCVSTDTDPDNCGSCGNSCNGDACVNGSCTTQTGGTCATCEATANSGTCASSYAACTGECTSLATCFNGCAGDTTCESTCYSNYPSGETAFESYFTCICGSACSSECATTCGQ